MKWMVHLTVVLLNVLWVAFFYTDPLEVFVQKRSSSSSDEEMMVGEFCLQTPSDLMWTFHVSADETTTATTDANREKKNTPDQSQSEPNHLNSSQFPQIRAPTADLNEATAAAPPLQKPTSAAGTSPLISSRTSEAAPVRTTGSSTAPGTQRNKEKQHVTANREKKNTPDQSHSEPNHLNSSQFPQIRAPTAVSTVRDLNEATAAAPPLQKPTSAAGTSQLISSRTSEAAPVRTTGSSTADVKKRNKQKQHVTGDCCVRYSRERVLRLRISRHYRQDTSKCPIKAIVVITTSGERLCFDPDDQWVQSTLEHLQRRETEEALLSDRYYQRFLFEKKYQNRLNEW